jgi:hypothetical protein
LHWNAARLPGPAALILALLANSIFASQASAHVKWFCAFDVAGKPRGLENVLCPDFELLVALALAILLSGCVAEGFSIGNALLRALDRVTQIIRDNTELLFRAGAGAFFVSLWVMGGIILTPELKTDQVWISWLQLAIAAGMLSRSTLPLSALGIAFLFALGVKQYGAFHLADYPVFLGVAVYLTLIGLQRDLFGMRPLDVVRWAAAITLMWASVEKWAYPEWSFPLLQQYPNMALGYDPEFFMRAAGVIEFTLAFALVWTPLVRRLGAGLLAAMFISAVFQFGKIDAIGHSMIIVVLLAIMADDARAHPQDIKLRHPALTPFAYGIALAGFLGAYYVAHAILFGSPLLGPAALLDVNDQLHLGMDRA